MNDPKNKNDDLTNIQDISEWEHSEEDLDSFDSFNDSTDLAENDLGDIEGQSLTDLNFQQDSLEENFQEEDFEQLDSLEEDETLTEVQETPSKPFENLEEEIDTEIAKDEIISASTEPEEIEDRSNLEGLELDDTLYTLKINELKNKKDKSEVLRILSEFKVINDETESVIKRSIERGEVIIPRIGEYLGISIAHKLRFLNLKLELGFNEEIFTSRMQDQDSTNSDVITFESKKEFDSHDIKSIDDVILSHTSQIDGHKIEKIMGTISAEKTVSLPSEDETMFEDLFEDSEKESKQFQTSLFKSVYQELNQSLKKQALHKSSNAVIGITYQHILLPKRDSTYHVIAHGTLSWIKKEN